MEKFDEKSTAILLDVRTAKLNAEIETSLLLKIGTSVNNCFFIASVYALVYNVLFCGFVKEDLKFVIPIIAYTGTSILNASRIDFLGPFFFIVTLSILFYQYKFYDDKYKICKNVFLYGGVGGIVFLAWFALLRYFRGGDFDVFDHLARYIAGGIYDFDQYYNGAIYPFLSSNTFGIHTFVALYEFVNDIFGIQLNEIAGLSSADGFFSTPTFQCNVYSAFCPLVEDFGMSGTIFMFFGVTLIMV